MVYYINDIWQKKNIVLVLSKILRWRRKNSKKMLLTCNSPLRHHVHVSESSFRISKDIAQSLRFVIHDDIANIPFFHCVVGAKKTSKFKKTKKKKTISNVKVYFMVLPRTYVKLWYKIRYYIIAKSVLKVTFLEHIPFRVVLQKVPVNLQTDPKHAKVSFIYTNHVLHCCMDSADGWNTTKKPFSM